ncbi:MAG: hypothetical protein IIC35_00565, partial [Gemmatimonadetes bacterium]|nr:hypothetical protein [Gemmatimonadota bacterium]
MSDYRPARGATAPRSSLRSLAVGALTGIAGVVFAASGVSGQTPTMPSTLRYGSGLVDIPVSSVLPHMTITATLSGFFSSLERRVQIDESGAQSGFGPGRDDFHSDGSLAVGL